VTRTETPTTAAAVATAQSVAALLDELEAPAPSPSGGTAAATAAAMGASLVVLVGRGSQDWPEGAGTAAQARALRERLLALGAADARAYAGVIDALRPVAGVPQERRDFALGQALVTAAEIPRAIAEAAADTAALAAAAATHGKASLRADAAVAAALAEAAARSAALLVEVNLATVAGDARSEQAAALVGYAREAARRATESL
jgi:methenyltetrahydrofolate cyclohydrolase